MWNQLDPDDDPVGFVLDAIGTVCAVAAVGLLLLGIAIGALIWASM